jgi:hypothetical protein
MSMLQFELTRMIVSIAINVKDESQSTIDVLGEIVSNCHTSSDW